MLPALVLDQQTAGQIDVEAATQGELGGAKAYRGVGGDLDRQL